MGTTNRSSNVSNGTLCVFQAFIYSPCRAPKRISLFVLLALLPDVDYILDSPFSLVSTTNDEHPMLSFWRGAKSVQTSKGPEVLMSCLECRIAADEFLNELELKRDATAKDIQGLVCDHVLPKNFTASCQDFLSMYLPTVLYMTYKQYTGVGICDKIHCCDQASLKAMAQISMSEQKTLAVHSCSALQSYVKENVHSAMMRVNGIAMAQETFCQPIPGFLQPLCYSTMERMVPSLLTKLAVVAGEGRFCSKN